MTDKELLELAAKAAGWTGWQSKHGYWNVESPEGEKTTCCNYWNAYCPDTGEKLKEPTFADAIYETGWNPLTDDGDALRLAVKLNLDITHSWSIVNGDDKYPMASIHVSYNNETFVYELKEADPYAATRRAIVRAAAEIGKDMK